MLKASDKKHCRPGNDMFRSVKSVNCLEKTTCFGKVDDCPPDDIYLLRISSCMASENTFS